MASSQIHVGGRDQPRTNPVSKAHIYACGGALETAIGALIGTSADVYFLELIAGHFRPSDSSHHTSYARDLLRKRGGAQLLHSGAACVGSTGAIFRMREFRRLFDTRLRRQATSRRWRPARK